MSSLSNINIRGDKTINRNPKGLLEGSPIYKPFRYPWAYDAWLQQQRLHWLPEEVPMLEDIKDWQNKLTPEAKHLVTQIFRFFTQADCYDKFTRVLTATGWKFFYELKDGEKVAQVDKLGRLSFVVPELSAKTMAHKHIGEIIHFQANGGRFDLRVTPNHNIVYKRDGQINKEKAKDVRLKNGDQIIVGVTPEFAGENTQLSLADKIKVAFHERGERFTRDGKAVYSFAANNRSEAEHILYLLRDGLKVSVEAGSERRDGGKSADIDNHIFLTVFEEDDKTGVLKTLGDAKTLSWIKLDTISSEWARDFVEEIERFSITREGGKEVYSTVKDTSAAIVQIVSLLAGYQAFITHVGPEERYKDYSLIQIIKEPDLTLEDVTVTSEPYEDKVYCVKVPSGNLIIERNGIPVVSGNCEVNNAYNHVYMKIFKPTEIQMMLTCFANIECFDKETELLTDSGWKFCPDIKKTDKIAQYDKATGEISFVTPDKVVSYPYNGVLHHYKNKKTDIMVTPNHDLILKHPSSGKVTKRKSAEGNEGYLYPTAGLTPEKNDVDTLTYLLVAIAVDGSISEESKSEFTFSYENKSIQLERIVSLLHTLKLKFKEGGDKERTTVTIDIGDIVNPYVLKNIKKFGFLKLEGMAPEFAHGVLDEILFLDSSCTDKRSSFSRSDKGIIETVQALAILAGVSAAVDHENGQYVITFDREGVWEAYPHREEVAYDDKVYCVSVPHQNLVSRRNGRVAITGNTIHIAAYSHLLDTVGMPETEYQAFLEYKEMVDKYEAMHDYAITAQGVEGELGAKKSIAKALAMFSGFMEGLQLFASFAILLNFPRHNLMKGMGQIVSWSIRDETCVSDDTEVLTSKGWKLFKDLDKTELLAQFEGVNNEISFAKPLHYTKKPYKGDMVRVQFNEEGAKADILVTPDHDMVLKGRDGVIKVKAEELHNYKSGYDFPVGSGQDGVKVKSWISVDHLHISRESYDGTVYCATMPKGTLVTRRNGSIGLIGNCHVLSMIKVFRTFVAENPEIWTEDLRSDIQELCRDCIRHEDAFIDLAFELGGVEGLTADEVKQYIRFIGNRRLEQMSIAPIFDVDENPLPWVDDMVDAVEHTNFFENRSTEYSRASTQGTWDEAFDDKTFMANGYLPSVRQKDGRGSRWIGTSTKETAHQKPPEPYKDTNNPR